MKNLASQSIDIDYLQDLFSSKEKLVSHLKAQLDRHETKEYIYKTTESVDAAVLIPLYFKDGEAHLLFTKRAENLEHHKGQISFPGGRKDDTDQNLLETALRETDEEIGVKKTDVSVLGQTDIFLTNTHFLVTPYVGIFDYPYGFTVNKAEIDRLIHVPLSYLVRDDIFEVRDHKKNSYTWRLHYYHVGIDVIWGVTGFLLSNFLSIVFGFQRNHFGAPILDVSSGEK